jgi:hypothetical protein
MVDFKKLMNQPLMTEEERQQLWDEWYKGLPESERKIVDKARQQAGEQEFNPDDYVEENPYRNPNGHPDKLQQQAGEP